MTIAPGLCSITFRQLEAGEVVALAVRAQVEGIEWGADGHAPPGGGAAIAALGERCRDAGVEVVSYGSYLGMGPPADDEVAAVEAVLDSAVALGAPMVRIWTEFGVTPASSVDERRRVTERTAELADAIAARGLLAALEFHPTTLTETAASARALIEAIDRPTLRTHWQPDPALSPVDAVAELRDVTPHLAHLHVFSWGPGGIADRRALADGAKLWTAALACAEHEGAAMSRYALCEYVRDDDPEQLVADVRTLRDWLDVVNAAR